MPRGPSSAPFAGSVTTGNGILTVAVGLSLTATAALGQTRITPEAFLSAVEGKTVSFHDYPSGELVGTEEFLSKKLSVWRRAGEGCVYGQITTPNGQVCFHYDNDAEGEQACWWPFTYEGALLVRLATFTYSEIQKVHSITEDGLDCPGAPIG